MSSAGNWNELHAVWDAFVIMDFKDNRTHLHGRFVDEIATAMPSYSFGTVNRMLIDAIDKCKCDANIYYPGKDNRPLCNIISKI